jgi:superfamily II DNA helicase RecQ
MDVKIKTFRIQSPSDEQSLNEFLTGKIVRHWGAQHESTAEGGVWNLMIAYELRVNEVRHAGDHKRDGSHRDSHRDGHRDGGGRDGGGRDGGGNRDRQPQKPLREKTPREEYQPQIAIADQPLFEAVRKWRNARAREERIKPFALFNNKQLESLVNAKPTTPEVLHGLVPDMDQSLWDKYQNELSGFIEAAAHSPAPAEA